MTESVESIILSRELVESLDKLRIRPYDKAIWGPVIFFSVLMHLFLLAFILFRPVTTTPQLTFGPYYTVDLVRSAEITGRSVQRSPYREEVARLPSETQGALIRKRAEMVAPPISRLDRREKPPPEIRRAIEDLRRKAGSGPLRNQGVATESEPAGEAQGFAASALEAYYGAIWSRIRDKWAFPPGLLSGQELVAVIHVRIMKSGAVENITLEKRSANAFFNESALNAVRKAAPYPPFPAGIRDQSMEVGIRFYSAELESR